MPLNKTDLTAIDNLIGKHLEPIRDMVLKHEQSLYGEHGNNGLKGDVGCLYDGMNKLREGRAKMQGAAGVLGLLGGIVTSIAAKIFLGK